jgi:hypothetical protein
MTYRMRRAGGPACMLFLVGVGCGDSSEPGQVGPAGSEEAGTVDSPGGGADAPTTMGTSDAAAEVSEGTDGSSMGEGGSPMVDAATQDAGPNTSVEAISISATGTPVSFKTTLVAGATYLLKAVGSVDIGAQKLDAEFAFAPNGTGEADKVGDVDVGIDVGLLELHAMNHTTKVPPGPGRMKWYGPFRADHTYYLWVTGAGMPLTLKLLTSGGAATGEIAVSLFELGPPPPAMYEPMPLPAPPPPAAPKIGRDAVETVQVPLTKTIVAGKYTTDAKAIYLLEASGSARVSKGDITPTHLHMGDAQYMDWPSDGSKYNDGECGAEFGIGVDELVGPDPCTGGNVYKHRLNWWGPYRNDHVYYMLYAGTGKPISFLYYDSGYGDNSTTDTLTVRIFPVP